MSSCGLFALVGCKKIPGLDVEDFAECRGGATNTEVSENLRIANEYASGIPSTCNLDCP